MSALRRGLAVAALLLATVPAISWADTAQWPNKPIRVVVSYPGGGVSDVAARALGEKRSVQLKALDNVPMGGDAEAFARQIAQELQNNAKIAKAANLRAHRVFRWPLPGLLKQGSA